MGKIPRIPGLGGAGTRRPHYEAPHRNPSSGHPDGSGRPRDHDGPDSRRRDGDPDSPRGRNDDDGRTTRDRRDRDGEDGDSGSRRDRDGEDRGGDVNVDVNVDAGGGDDSGNGSDSGSAGSCTPGGSTSPGGSSAPLAQQCDTEGITGAINDVVEALRKAQKMFNDGLNLLSKAIDAAQRMTLGLLPWLDGVQAAVKVAQFQMNLQYNAIIEVIEQLSAPWFIKCFGDKIVQGIGPKVEDLDADLDPANCASYRSWQGDASDKFFKRADLQYDASGQSLEGVMKFGQSMQIMGDIGISATITFLIDLGFCMVQLMMAIVEIALVPVGTAVSLGQIIAVAIEVLGLIAVFVTFCTTASSSATEFITAVENVPMSGRWPAGVARA